MDGQHPNRTVQRVGRFTSASGERRKPDKSEDPGSFARTHECLWKQNARSHALKLAESQGRQRRANSSLTCLCCLQIPVEPAKLAGGSFNKELYLQLSSCLFFFFLFLLPVILVIDHLFFAIIFPLVPSFCSFSLSVVLSVFMLCVSSICFCVVFLLCLSFLF